MKALGSLFILLAVAEAAFALSSDRYERIHISSDTATIDDKTGLSTYTGNVRVEQGTLQISADRVEVHVEANLVTRIVASVDENSSHLVQYEQLPDDKPLVKAKARLIVYYVRDERLTLTGNAQLSQTADRSFDADNIEYEVSLGRVSATSGGDRRVNTTIRPAQK